MKNCHVKHTRVIELKLVPLPQQRDARRETVVYPQVAAHGIREQESRLALGVEKGFQNENVLARARVG